MYIYDTYTGSFDLGDHHLRLDLDLDVYPSLFECSNICIGVWCKGKKGLKGVSNAFEVGKGTDNMIDSKRSSYFYLQWAFAILFLDSLAYGYPHSVRCLCPLLPRWSSRSSLARDRNSLIYSTTGASIEEDDAIPTTEAEMVSQRGSLVRDSYVKKQQRQVTIHTSLPLFTSICSITVHHQSHTWIDASSRPHGSSIPLRMGRIRDEPTTDSSSFTACRLFVTTFDMNKCYLPQQGDCDYQEERQRPEGVSSPSSSYHRNPLSEGLEAWIPSVGYHVYAIAVQRCRLGQLARLRAAIHEHLGKYILSLHPCLRHLHHLIFSPPGTQADRPNIYYVQVLRLREHFKGNWLFCFLLES